MTRFKIPFWRVVAFLIFVCAAYATWGRFTGGLGAVTNLNDRYPWGLWIGFDILCGVGLAAGGFAITTAVYIFHLERLRPIVRPTVLTAFLGYLLVVLALMFDLGRPWAIWHAIVMWNPHSVMFEVAWCVMLYSTVLALEFSPVVFERFGWKRAQKIVKIVVVPLVGAGFLLSTLHQSSLGTLYLILPSKMHPLWYSPILPVLFWLSAVAVGLAMVIFESGMSARAFGHALDLDLLQGIAKVMSLFAGLFTIVRFWDLLARGTAGYVLQFGGMEAQMFWLEMLLFIAGLSLALVPRVQANARALFGCSILVISGFLVNRLNVSLTSLEASAKVRYIPSFEEVIITVAIVTLGLVVFNFAVKNLPVVGHVEVKPAVHA